MAKTKQNGKKQESRALPQIKADAGRESLTPFSFVRSFMDEMDRLAGNFGLGRGLLSSTELDLPRGMWAPQVEMFERDGQLVVRADLPGMSKDEVKVQLDNNALTIEGERRIALSGVTESSIVDCHCRRASTLTTPGRSFVTACWK